MRSNMNDYKWAVNYSNMWYRIILYQKILVHGDYLSRQRLGFISGNIPLFEQIINLSKTDPIAFSQLISSYLEQPDFNIIMSYLPYLDDLEIPYAAEGCPDRPSDAADSPNNGN